MRRLVCCGLLTGAVLCAVACGEGDLGSGASGGVTHAPPPSSDAEEGEPGGDIDVGGEPRPVVQTETEVPAFEPPVLTGNFLWSANPQSGRVAVIDSATLSTRVLTGGLEPTFLAPVFDDRYQASVVVLNTGSADLSLFRMEADELSALKIPLHLDANRVEVSEAGRYAVAWRSVGLEDTDPTEGNQEVAILDLHADPIIPRRVSVDLLPHLVQFNRDESELVVVSQYGVSIFELGSERVRFVRLPEGTGRDVSVTEDGRYALALPADSNTIEVVPLTEGASGHSLSFDSPITDLDVTAGGRAVAVIRDESRVVTFAVEALFADANAVQSVVIPDARVGSAELTESGERAVLYTNATPSSQVTVLELGGESALEYRSLDVKEPVHSVHLSPDGSHGIVAGRGAEGSSAGVFAAFSLTQDLFPRIIGTQAPLVHIAVGDEYAVVTASEETGEHEAHLVSFDRMSAERVKLSSPPLSTGVLPEIGRGYVSQKHLEGRVTFFELETASAQTLTGFELSAKIVQE